MIFIIASVVNFAIVLLILWKYVMPLARTFVSGRSKKISDFVVEAQSEYLEKEKNLTQWKKRRNNAKVDVKNHFEDAKGAFNNQRGNVIAKAEQQAVRIEEDGKLLCDGEVVKAKRDLQIELVDKSVEKALSFFKSSLGDDEQKRLVSDYLEQLHA